MIDNAVESNREVLSSRSRIGMSKYGCVLQTSSISEKDLLQHAREEALDLANYLAELIARIDALNE
jgi:hypothetical protein